MPLPPFSSTAKEYEHLSDIQETPLLHSPYRDRASPGPLTFRLFLLLRSRFCYWSLTVILVCSVVILDRLYWRNPLDPDLLNYHLSNAIASRLNPLQPLPPTNQSAPAFCPRPFHSLRTLSPPSTTADGSEFGTTMLRGLGKEECVEMFPNLYKELERSVAHYNARGKITLAQLDNAIQHGHARVLIYRNRMYIKQFNGGPGKRTEAILSSIQEAVISSAELLPDVEFVVKTTDAPQGGDDVHPLWVLDRTEAQTEMWLMPDYGFYSWPEPKVGGMIEVRDKCAMVEARMGWRDKIPKAFWRGAILVKIREQLLEVAKGHRWSDVAPIVWNKLDGSLKTPEEHCRYKYLIHTEGFAYSGRLKYLQMCRSVVVAHELKYIQHFHHLLDPTPHSPTQNVALVPGPGFEGLPKLMDELIADDRWAETIANNSYPLFRHYLSPAGVNCYWRQMFRSWAEVQDFVPVRTPKDTPFESFNLMHTTEWEAY